ncbi:MAG: Flp pilus assembly protein CpaB [Legionellales bacterium]|nr:Flp pilus assembly protein CpaB [Legionellales bacterium]
MAKKEQTSAIPLILGAVVLGVIAAVMASLFLNAKERELKALYGQKETTDTTVVVPARDLVKGTEILMEDFQLLSIPTEFVHNDAIYREEFDQYIGRVITANISAGKPLLKSFIDDTFPRDFSDIIPEGKRAITISVDELHAIGGFLRPGNRIDLYVNIPFSVSGFQPSVFTAAQDAGALELLPKSILEEIPPELMTVAASVDDPTQLLGALLPTDVIIPVLQNITVLATGRVPYNETLDSMNRPQRQMSGGYANITLEVDVEQAALITLAEDNGDMITLLRNRNDESASSFTSISPLDLFGNAAKIASAEKDRASRVTAVAGVDVNGNLVDADGNKLIDSKQLAAAGLSVNENGDIVDKDGNIVDPNDLVIAADGSVINKQQLAAAGLTVNESGQIIDKDGNVVDASDVLIAADGTVLTKGQLAAAGLSVNENGEIVDANGKVVAASDVIVSENGTVMTKESLEALQAAGYSVNENGEVVDKDGNVVDTNSLVIAADGTVMTKEQLAAAGLSVNDMGEVVDANGNVIDRNDLILNANGEIVDAKGNRITSYELIIGGASEDGVAKSTMVIAPTKESD